MTFQESFAAGGTLVLDGAMGTELERRGALVLGNLSSTGLLMEPYGELTEAAAVACFSEQALCLAAGEIDAFIIETMMDLREAVCALRACRAVSPLPEIVAEMGAATRLPLCAEPNAGRPRLEGARTVFDMDAETFGRGVMACAAAGARILGGCCGTTPAHLSALVEALGERRGGASSPCS